MISWFVAKVKTKDEKFRSMSMPPDCLSLEKKKEKFFQSSHPQLYFTLVKQPLKCSSWINFKSSIIVQQLLFHNSSFYRAGPHLLEALFILLNQDFFKSLNLVCLVKSYCIWILGQFVVFSRFFHYMDSSSHLLLRLCKYRYSLWNQRVYKKKKTLEVYDEHKSTVETTVVIGFIFTIRAIG